MVLPSRNSPCNILSVSGSCSSRWMARSVSRVLALAGQAGPGRIGHFELQAAIGEQLPHAVELDVHNLRQMLHRQAVEHYHLVDPVEKLGPEADVPSQSPLSLLPRMLAWEVASSS